MTQVKLLLQDGFNLLSESGDAILLQRDQNVKTFTFGSVLKKTYPNNRHFLKEDGDNLLTEAGDRILFEDHVDGKTFTFGALLSRPVALKTFTLGSTLKQTLTKTFTFGSTLKQINSKTFTFAGVIKRSFSTRFLLLQTGDFILKEDSGKIQLEDLAGGKTFTLGAILVFNKLKTFTFGANIYKVALKTFTFGATITGRYNKTFTFGSVLKALKQLKTFTLGAKISLVQLKTFTFGARIDRYQFLTETIIPLLTSDEEFIAILGQLETNLTLQTTNETEINLEK